MEHKHVTNIDMKSGWEKTLDAKAKKVKRQHHNGRLFCVHVKKGTVEKWTPYKPPRSRAEVVARLYGEEK
ncbi:MAG: hypothetical protein OXG44_01310 [Gammaproteobacteria bacterium]|nr:hypothetical protein [Gammaproteobacteria bacterium]